LEEVVVGRSAGEDLTRKNTLWWLKWRLRSLSKKLHPLNTSEEERLATT
jgi:hypothetical protein